MNFSYIAGRNDIHREKNYINSEYLQLKYKFENLKLTVSSGKDAEDSIFILIKVIVNGIKKVIYIFQKNFYFHLITDIFNNCQILTPDIMAFLDKLFDKNNLKLTKKEYPKLNPKYNNKRIFLYSDKEWYAAITIQRAWLKYSSDPKYKYCKIYNINKLINETDINSLNDEFKPIHYKYLFDRTMIALKNKFLKT